jgi:hypothetical protein
VKGPHRRLGSAHAIAFVALFVALAGGAWAAHVANNSVGSGTIRNGSIKGKDVHDDTLTGQQIDESSLGEVASAKSADTAKIADTAQTAANVIKVDFHDTYDADRNLPPILDAGGMKLFAVCGTGTLLAGVVSSTPAEINVSYTQAGPSNGPDPGSRSNEVTQVRGSTLKSENGDAFGIFETGELVTSAGSLENAEGQLVFRSDSAVVTLTFHAYVSEDNSNNTFCELNGTALGP